MTGSFILDYYLLVLFSASGLFQIAAARTGLRGLLIFHRRWAALVLGAVLMTGAFAWFFLSQSRNVPDTALGMNGNEQFAYFFAGSGTALAITLVLSSLRNWPLGAGAKDIPPGLDGLRNANYARALWSTWRSLSGKLSQLSGSPNSSRALRAFRTIMMSGLVPPWRRS